MSNDNVVVRIGFDLRKKVEVLAAAQDLTLSQVVRQALRRWVYDSTRPDLAMNAASMDALLSVFNDLATSESTRTQLRDYIPASRVDR